MISAKTSPGRSRLPWFAAFAVVAACSSGGGATSGSASSSAAPPAPSARPSAARSSDVHASASAVANASASALPSASAAASDAPSPEPELAEWGKAPLASVGGARQNGCEARWVREWLRLLCPATPDLGDPDKIVIVKGRTPNEYYRGENLKMVNHVITLVQPVRRGADFEARFEWASASHTLDVTFPSNAKAPNVDFDNKPVETADVSGAKPGEAAADLPPVEPAIDDVANLAPPPSDADWDAAKEVTFAASSDIGCETKVVGSWFRAKCKDPKYAVTAVEFQKGHHKTQSTATVASGVGTVVTPYVEGTETWARVHFDARTFMMVLRWSKGPKPASAGAFEALK